MPVGILTGIKAAIKPGIRTAPTGGIYSDVATEPDWTLYAPVHSPLARRGSASFELPTGVGLAFGDVGAGTGSLSVSERLWTGTPRDFTTPSTSGSPAIVELPLACYDVARAQYVSAGGYDGVSVTSATWVRSAAGVWSNSGNALPAVRFAGACAYDSARGKVVAYGGGDAGGSPVSTFYERAGNSWSTIAASGSPPALEGAAMCFDAARGKMLIFGGYDGADYVATTATYDGVTYAPITPTTSPPKRYLGKLAYDSVRRVCVLFGGQGAGAAQLSDVWEWDGADWTQVIANTVVAARESPVLAWDAGLGKIIMTGGWDGAANLSDTYVYGLVPALASISVAPATATIAAAATQQLVATAKFSDGSTRIVVAAWASGDAAATVGAATGLVTGASPGIDTDVTITATYRGKTASAVIAVQAIVATRAFVDCSQLGGDGLIDFVLEMRDPGAAGNGHVVYVVGNAFEGIFGEPGYTYVAFNDGVSTIASIEALINSTSTIVRVKTSGTPTNVPSHATSEFSEAIMAGGIG